MNLLNTIGIEWLGGPLIRARTSQGDVAGRPASWNLSGIDLIREITVDHEFGPSSRSDAGFVGIDSGNRGDNPIGLGEIKPWVHAEAHYRGGGMGFALTGDDT